MRHTMGQDWGGRKKANPDNVPKITKGMVEVEAIKKGFTARREGGNFSYWWLLKNNKRFIGLGMTNYIAFMYIKNNV